MASYLEMPPEPSVGKDPETGRYLPPPARVTPRRLLFSYHELVRRNYVKDYDSIVQLELEEHLTDSEFLVRFNMSKVLSPPALPP
jgi:hypothetical protein